MIRTLLCSVGLCIACTQGFAQHSLLLDAGGGRYAQLVASGSLPVGVVTFTLGDGSGTVVTSDNVDNYAWILGGNTSPASNLLGTVSATDLDIITTNARRMRVASGGNVQIGTGGTPNLFEVDGSDGNLAKIRNTSYSWPAANPAAVAFLRNDGSGGLTWHTGSTATDRAGIGTWHSQNVGGGTSTFTIPVSGTNMNYVVLPFAGSITGVSIALNDVRTGGTLTATVTLNGAATALTAEINGTDTEFAHTSVAAGTITFAAGQRIGIDMTKATFAPTTADMLVTVFVQF
jgi:hypothetical protein